MSKDPFPDKIRYVFSKTKKDLGSGIHIINQDVEKEVRSIKDQKGKDIWLFGGTGLITTLINHGLVDELQLAVHPIILGQGKPLFKDIKERLELKLIDTTTYSSGLVQLFFEFENQ
jgi:dihydrofolate reductase